MSGIGSDRNNLVGCAHLSNEALMQKQAALMEHHDSARLTNVMPAHLQLKNLC